MLADRSLQGTASSDHLDLIRGSAALIVLLCHLRSLFFVDFPEVAGSFKPLLKPVYLASNWGHYAVMIFFVLSGFLVGGTVLRGWIERKFSWSLYATNRLARLWVVLIPALLLGAIWDHSRIHFFGTLGIYGLPPGSVDKFAVSPVAGRVMLGNALFVQGILTTNFGSNGALWSLSYEFWYYVLFPLILLALPRRNGIGNGLTVVYVTATFMVVLFIGQPIRNYFLIWLLGAAINLLPETSGLRADVWIGTAVVALLSVLAAVGPPSLEGYLPADIAVGVATAFLIYALLQGRGRSTEGLYSSAVRTLAAFSYTLYVVHLPLLVFFGAWLVPRRRWQPDAAHIAIVAGLGICALGYAFAVSQLTERQTSAVRSRAIAAFGLGSRAG
jgi:peptidoglycan/LPS O-acetylase OafA/YrhL